MKTASNGGVVVVVVVVVVVKSSVNNQINEEQKNRMECRLQETRCRAGRQRVGRLSAGLGILGREGVRKWAEGPLGAGVTRRLGRLGLATAGYG